MCRYSSPERTKLQIAPYVFHVLHMAVRIFREAPEGRGKEDKKEGSDGEVREG